MDDEQIEELVATIGASLAIIITIAVGTYIYSFIEGLNHVS